MCKIALRGTTNLVQHLGDFAHAVGLSYIIGDVAISAPINGSLLLPDGGGDLAEVEGRESNPTPEADSVDAVLGGSAPQAILRTLQDEPKVRGEG